jgi:hypothetical protein
VVLPLALLLLLAGCASTPQYMAPPYGNTANLIFANQTSKQAFARHYLVALDCREPRALPSIDVRGEVQVPVAAGSEWAFVFGAGDEKAMCVVAGSFRPEKGRSYRATLRDGAPGCILSLVELPDNGRVAFRPKAFSTPYSPTGPFCVPL